MLRRMPPLLGLLLFVGAIYAVQKEVRHLSVGQIRDSLLSIPHGRLLASAGFTLLSYFVLSFYDRLATMHVGCRLSYRRTAFAAFCSYVLSHNLGFAAISGAAVRFRLYGNWGLRPVEITQIIAFCSVTYILGASALIGGVLLLEPSSLPMLLDRVPAWLLTVVGLTAWSVVALYVGLSARLQSVTVWRWTIPLPGVRMSIGQVVVSALDVGCTAAIAYALLPAGIGLDYPAFLAIYIASYSAGLIAGVPGGLGVFDGAMVLGLSRLLPASEALGVILVFRLFYYIVRLFIAGLLFAGHEVLLRGDMMLARHHGLTQPAQVRTSTLIRESEADFAVIVAAGAVSLCGAMLLALGAIGTTPDLAFALPPPVGLFGGESAFSWFLEAAGDYIPSLIGAVLMGLAIGLSQRVTLAWGATLILLCAAAALTALRGLPLAVPGMLILAALVIAPFRGSYYRHARLLSEPLAPATVLPLLLLMGCVLILVQLEPAIRSLADNSWLELVAGHGMSGRTRLSVGLSVLVGLLAIARLILPGRISPTPWNAEAAARYQALAPDSAPPPASPDGLVSGETGRALIPFRRLGRIMAGLGDPAGAPADQISTIWRLRDLALQEGREPVFWRVGSSLLDVYADLGLQAWPIEAPMESMPGVSGERCYLCCPAERGELLLALLGQEFEPTVG